MKHNRTRNYALSLTLGLLLIINSTTSAQQQAFSYNQYADNLTILNSAYSVVDKAGSVSLLGRKQFVGIDGAPTTFLFSGDIAIPRINAAAGVTIINDKFAIENLTEVNAFFAKAIQLTGKTNLAVSLNAGFKNYRADYASLDATDPIFGTNIRETQPNLGFGVMVYNDDYYVGLSVPQLNIRSLGNASLEDAVYLQNRYYLAGAYLIKSNDIAIKPATLLAYTKGLKLNVNVSTTVYFKDFLGIGANYNSDSQFGAMLSVNTRRFRVGYSYEFGTSNNGLQGYNNATNEVLLSYRFGDVSSIKLL